MSSNDGWDLVAFWKCDECDAEWREFKNGSANLISEKCGHCCDNRSLSHTCRRFSANTEVCFDRNHEGLNRVMGGARLPDSTLGQDAAFMAMVIGDKEKKIEKLCEDIMFLSSLIPESILQHEPGLCPTMYITGSSSSDLELAKKIREIHDRVQNASRKKFSEVIEKYE